MLDLVLHQKQVGFVCLGLFASYIFVFTNYLYRFASLRISSLQAAWSSNL